MANAYEHQPPVTEDPKRVLVGKVLVKAGADKKTLRMFEELVDHLEMDRKPFTLATSLPPVFYLGENDTEEEPEKPLILFSILRRAGSKTEAKELARTWQEQNRGTPVTRPILLGSIDDTPPPAVRWLRRLRDRRSAFTALEKFSLSLLVCQSLAMVFLLISGFQLTTRPLLPSLEPIPKFAAAPSVVLPVPLSKPAVSVVVSKPITVAPPAKAKGLPVVKLDDFIYYSGGRVKIQWAPAGKRFRYEVYLSKDTTLNNVYPASTQAITQTEFMWTKNSGVNWIRVRTVDSSGRKGRFSEPAYVGLN